MGSIYDEVDREATHDWHQWREAETGGRKLPVGVNTVPEPEDIVDWDERRRA